MKLFAFTLDLEPDYAGVLDQYRIFQEPEKVEEFLDAVSSMNVKTTVFTQGKIFEEFPDIIKLFEKYNCEFEAHSYSHDLKFPDSEYEISNAKKAYQNYFNKQPAGYRAPRGVISDAGIKTLAKHGFLYDSSIFPSFFPNPFKYLFHNKGMHNYGDSGILEIPFTVVSPFRITLSISYIKLLGINFFLRRSLPDIICFDSHLHDFIISDYSFSRLPIFWKLIYSRNKYRGIEYCLKFFEHVKNKGYDFCFMSDIYKLHREGRI